MGIVDSSGTILGKYNYDAYGNIISNTVSIENHIIYKCYYYDNEIEMYYLRSRFYVPKWRRFLTPDSIDYLDYTDLNKINLYAYCGNNPVMYSDGDGTFATLIILGLIGVAIGFGVAAYIDSQDGKMFNGDVQWYDYLGASVIGGLLGLSLGWFAGLSWSFTIPTFGFVNTGGALAIGITGTTAITITGTQILTGVGAIGLVLMSKLVGNYGGYEVRHNYPNDHEPPHVHIYGDDIHRGSHGIRVGMDGKPLKGEPNLSPKARRAIKKLLEIIRKTIKPWMR